jgi:hypothetical protein
MTDRKENIHFIRSMRDALREITNEYSDDFKKLRLIYSRDKKGNDCDSKMINYLTKKAVKFSTPKKRVTPEIIIEKVNNEVDTVSYELDSILTELKDYEGGQIEQFKKTVTDEIESLDFMKRVDDCKIKIFFIWYRFDS